MVLPPEFLAHGIDNMNLSQYLKNNKNTYYTVYITEFKIYAGLYWHKMHTNQSKHICSVSSHQSSKTKVGIIVYKTITNDWTQYIWSWKSTVETQINTKFSSLLGINIIEIFHLTANPVDSLFLSKAQTY